MPNYTPANANLLVNSCVGVEASPNSAVALPPEWETQRWAFGYWSRFPVAPPDPQTTRTPRFSAGQNLVTGQLCSPSWWNVTVYGLENCRVVAGGSEIVPLSQQQIIEQGVRTTHLKGRLLYTSLGVPRQVDFDIGTGITMSVNTPTVQVQLLVPQRFTQVDDENPAPYRARGSGGGMIYQGSARAPQPIPAADAVPGLIVDAIVGATVIPCFGPHSGQNEATYTENVVLNAGEGPINFAIPSAAKAVTIFSKDGLLDPWCFMDCNGFGPIANLDFGTGLSPDTVTLPVPQTATFLQSPAAVATSGFVLQWALEF